MKEIDDQNDRELISSQEEYLEMSYEDCPKKYFITNPARSWVGGLENIPIDEIRAEYEIIF